MRKLGRNEHLALFSALADQPGDLQLAIFAIDQDRIVAAPTFAAYGVAMWPGVAINYTTETQYVSRINKGIPNSWNNVDINIWTPEAERPMPFARMIFIGDGETDIPTMKMLTQQGGHSIAVYDPDGTPHHRRKIHRLISENRVNFVAAAGYFEGSQLDILVGILGRIARAHGYRGDDGV
jgi:hypothetical protein